MSMDARVLLEAAVKARYKAHAPYSNFPVGAAILMEDGSVYTGCNVENASFGLTNCAERTAIELRHVVARHVLHDATATFRGHTVRAHQTETQQCVRNASESVRARPHRRA